MLAAEPGLTFERAGRSACRRAGTTTLLRDLAAASRGGDHEDRADPRRGPLQRRRSSPAFITCRSRAISRTSTTRSSAHATRSRARAAGRAVPTRTSTGRRLLARPAHGTLTEILEAHATTRRGPRRTAAAAGAAPRGDRGRGRALVVEPVGNVAPRRARRGTRELARGLRLVGHGRRLAPAALGLPPLDRDARARQSAKALANLFCLASAARGAGTFDAGSRSTSRRRSTSSGGASCFAAGHAAPSTERARHARGSRPAHTSGSAVDFAWDHSAMARERRGSRGQQADADHARAPRRRTAAAGAQLARPARACSVERGARPAARVETRKQP